MSETTHAETAAALLREVADEYEQMTDVMRWEHLTAANTHAILALYEGNQQGGRPGPAGADEGRAATGAALIAAERQRQIEQEGWTPEHDAEHGDDALALAAAVYALPVRSRGHRSVPHPGNTGDRGDAWRYVPYDWPWDPEWYKPTPDDRVRELVKAGALIAAEIDRLSAPSPAARP